MKFYWNGIKTSDHQGLQKCWFSKGEYTEQTRIPNGTITIYKRDYDGFSAEIHAAFAVENDTDIMTDYFEKDRIRVYPSHPLYGAVDAAHTAHQAHFNKLAAKRLAA